MKEKEVDVYLSLASLCHLVTIADGTVWVTELVKETKRFEVLFLSSLVLILSVVILIIVYARVFEIVKNKR